MPIYATDQNWILETQTTGYALGVNQAGLLTHRYWGTRLLDGADYPPALDPGIREGFNSPAQFTPEEYPGYGDLKFIEPCLKVTFADGVRDVVLRFESAEVHEGETPELHIHLRDTISHSA